MRTPRIRFMHNEHSLYAFREIRRLSLKQYRAADHLTVATLANVQSIPDKQLADLGKKRRFAMRVPYFGVALASLPNTELLLTLTSDMRSLVESNPHLRLVKAPPELVGFHFLMAWHPRLDSDARHAWLREAVKAAVNAI
jgi:hypothetical protein